MNFQPPQISFLTWDQVWKR